MMQGVDAKGNVPNRKTEKEKDRHSERSPWQAWSARHWKTKKEGSVPGQSPTREHSGTTGRETGQGQQKNRPTGLPAPKGSHKSSKIEGQMS
ncbi:hypothetical protein E2C01_040791 [Portunus trituberculatus]|uniref:Uncharacterized protein n=1 Tax=Portunus trituberculatus TaxID=210409 RepID=A0A5B7FNX4_PORTR|nr:hypothetical protein [Portunus trituberculatus]